MTETESDFTGDFQRVTHEDKRLIGLPGSFEGKNNREKISFLHQLASSQNHAAMKIQGERDELGRLCATKEKALESMRKTQTQDRRMLQEQVTTMNARAQDLLDENKKLYAEIKALEDKLTLLEQRK